MIVTEKDAHDFCVAAATIIPVLVLTRFIGERTPFEIAGQLAQQEKEKARIDFEKIENEIASLEIQISQSENMRSSRFRRLRRGGRSMKQNYSQGELEEARSWVKALRGQLEDIRIKSNRADLLTEKNIKFDLTFSVFVTAVMLCAGIIGEFTSLLGILGVIDRRLAIAIPILCINSLLFMLVILAFARFLIGKEALENSGVRLAGYFIVSVIPLALIVLLTLFASHLTSLTP